MFPIAVSSFILLFPVCVLFGYMFALACSIYQTKTKFAAGKIINVYILEAIGSGLAGILVSLFLIRLFDSLEILIFISILNLLAALFLIFLSSEKLRKLLFVFYGTLIILFSLFLMGQGIEKLNSRVNKFQWKGYEVIESRNSIYANITVAKRNNQTVFFENGLLLFAVPYNKKIAEDSTHFTLLEDTNPQEILLIGGGAAGLLEEILKYPVKHIDYLEIDPLVIELSKEYLPENLRKSLNDKRVKIENVDARFFVKSSGKKYDCIIIHAGSPLTAQLNRYYTVQFFRQLKDRLNDGGVISFSLNSSENYINKELKLFLRSIYISLKKSFSGVKVIPGDEAYFIASDNQNYLTYDYKELLRRLNERNIETKYVREYYLFSRLSAERISYIEKILNGKPEVLPNYDFKPAGYFYNLVFWTTYFKDSVFTWLLKSVTVRNLWLIFAGFIFAGGLTGFIRLRHINFRREISFFSVFIAGFSVMAFQILILLSFQIIYGYLFYKLGFIMSAFMVGLVLGSYFALRFPIFKTPFGSLKLMQFLIFLYALALPFIFNLLLESKSLFVGKLGENVIFILLPVICGILSGGQFSYANKVCLKSEVDSAKIGGLTYALDLLGSCIAAFVTAVFLIPVMGILQACLLVAGINLFVWMFFLLALPANQA